MATHKSSLSDAPASPLVNDLKAFYNNAGAATMDIIDRIYTQDVEFRDPVHTIHGRLGLKNYLRNLYTSASSVHFDYQDEQISANSASITWLMTYSHPKLNGGKPVDVRGISTLRFTDKIYYHEDFYDMGAMVYQHVPVLGAVVRHINQRLAATPPAP
jgi:hypothetical protein